MPDNILWLDPAEIKINREQRQRQMNLVIDDLIPTIRKFGVLQPMIVDDDNYLLVGERRLMTCNFLKLAVAPFRRMSDLSPVEKQIIELDENVKRKDLTWQDQAKAVLRIHKLYVELNGEEHSVDATAQLLGMNDKHVYKMIDLGEAILTGDKSVAEADTIANATTILARRRQRQTAEAMNRILEISNADITPDETLDEVADLAGITILRGGNTGADQNPTSSGPHETAAEAVSGLEGVRDPAPSAEVGSARNPAPPYTIVCADAHDFFRDYRGPRFNFLHCDFPYGVELHGQAQQDNFEGGGYDSDANIYWKLCHSLCANWEKVLFPSSHVMFWISMNFYQETIEFFQRECPDDSLSIQPIPLIWHKTDNRGILSDPKRRPRNIGEYALIMSTGDRNLVKPLANIYGSPTAKAEAIHTNEKPEPMLRHFFSMFVDHHSRVLDPTAGSGSSIRVAESLGAEAALGLEFNPEFADRAQTQLVRARGLRSLSRQIDAEAKSTVD